MQYKTRKLSSLLLHPDYRWDGEYLSVEPYKNKHLKYVPLGDTVISTQYGKSIAMSEDGIGTRIYRMNEIGNVICDRNISKYADLNAAEIELYRLKDRDVLFNRTNSQPFVGRTGIFRKFSDENIVFASYLVRVNPNPEVITPEYLTAFLNTKYGILDVKRRARISINQSNVNAEELKRVDIPLLCDELQTKITQSFDNAFSLIKASEVKYHQAENAFLTEFGLVGWCPKLSLSFVKNFSDIRNAERVDADYFQPKYTEIEESIRNYPGGWDMLGNLVHIQDSNFKPEEEIKYSYIELADIGINGEVTECIISEGKNLPTRARRRVEKGDVIVSSIEGSLDRIALIDRQYDQALCSNGFYILKSNVINPETLLVLMKTKIGQYQLRKGCAGTILSAISKNKLERLYLPRIRENIQAQIQQKVTECFSLRNRSKHLLESAKRSVEIAIEQDEKTAIDWLESNAETE